MPCACCRLTPGDHDAAAQAPPLKQQHRFRCMSRPRDATNAGPDLEVHANSSQWRGRQVGQGRASAKTVPRRLDNPYSCTHGRGDIGYPVSPPAQRTQQCSARHIRVRVFPRPDLSRPRPDRQEHRTARTAGNPTGCPSRRDSVRHQTGSVRPALPDAREHIIEGMTRVSGCRQG
jgi:hypothetical protein